MAPRIRVTRNGAISPISTAGPPSSLRRNWFSFVIICSLRQRVLGRPEWRDACPGAIVAERRIARENGFPGDEIQAGAVHGQVAGKVHLRVREVERADDVQDGVPGEG